MSVIKRNKKWWVDFCFERARYRRPSPDNSKPGALKYELLLRQKLAKGEPLDPPEKMPSFNAFAKSWFATYVKSNNKHSEILSKEMILRVHLLPYFAPRPLDKIRSLDVEQYKAQKIAEGLSFKTINNHLAVLHKSLQCALEWEVIPNLPIIKKLRLAPLRHDFLTLEECQKLLMAADGMWHAMITVALGTGLRFGELIALRWQDVDFASGTLTVCQSYAKGVLGSPKNNRIRQIPLSGAVTRVLFQMRKPHGLVFTNPHGAPLKHSVPFRTLHRLCHKAGLRPIGWHVLRHTFASHLAQAGANLASVQGLLGHSDIRMTMRYAHINGAALKQAIGMLDQAAVDLLRHNSVTIADSAVQISPKSKPKQPRYSAKTKEKRACALSSKNVRS